MSKTNLHWYKCVLIFLNLQSKCWHEKYAFSPSIVFWHKTSSVNQLISCHWIAVQGSSFYERRTSLIRTFFKKKKIVWVYIECAKLSHSHAMTCFGPSTKIYYSEGYLTVGWHFIMLSFDKKKLEYCVQNNQHKSL